MLPPPSPKTYLDILCLLTHIILTASELGAPEIQKKKWFQIEDEDENDWRARILGVEIDLFLGGEFETAGRVLQDPETPLNWTEAVEPWVSPWI